MHWLKSKRGLVFAGLFLLVVAAAALFWRGQEAPSVESTEYKPHFIDAAELLHLTEVLSNDALEGRRIGTPGNEAARGFLRKRFETLGLAKIGDSYEHAFTVIPADDAPADAPTHGTNLLGIIEGKTPGEGKMLVISAHFDHLGVIDGQIYNGADDNASGSAALIAVATWFTRHKPEHDILFALLDGEEEGFLGARSLVRSGEVDMSRVALDINFDMVSRSDVGELYVAGTHQFPGLAALLDDVSPEAAVTLIAGHDRPELGHDDWTNQSDHAAFYETGIPFLYFGVEDHPDYHQPTDDFEKIPQDFFVRSADTLVMVARAADEALDTLDLSPAVSPATQP
ncbi:MAG TPA: M28 family peptidase [Hyphomonas sp.]|nr:M28 family peptidase [Hyphomonas sp.]